MLRGATAPPPPQLHGGDAKLERQVANHGTLNSKHYRRDKAALLIPLH